MQHGCLGKLFVRCHCLGFGFDFRAGPTEDVERNGASNETRWVSRSLRLGLCWPHGNDAALWDAAIAVSPSDSKIDQAERFPICQPDPLRALFTDTGLKAVSCQSIEIPTVFKNFDDYWIPFLGKQGAAPTYLASVDDGVREQIRARLQARLLLSADGTIQLRARAWGIEGTVAKTMMLHGKT